MPSDGIYLSAFQLGHPGTIFYSPGRSWQNPFTTRQYGWLTHHDTIGTGKSTRIYFIISNLTDDEFSTVVGYPDFGRRISFGFTFGMQQNLGISLDSYWT